MTNTISINTNPNPIAQRRNRRRNRQRNRRNSLRIGNGGNPPTRKQLMTYPELLSTCSRDFVSVMENPWSGKVACIPSLPSVPSRKVRYWARGVFSTGTIGIGFVAFNPFAVTSNSAGNNENCVTFSLNAYAGGAIANGATGTGSAQLNSEFTNANILNVRYRMVGAGLRIRYIGTEMARGGRVFMVEEPDHGDLVGQNIAQVSRYDGHRVFRPDDRWKSVTSHPADEDEFDYISFPDRSSNFFLGCLVAAANPAEPIEYEFECSAIYEFIGPGARGVTPTPVDVVGLSAIQTFSNTLENRAPREGDRAAWVNTALNHIGRLLWNTASGIVRSQLPLPVTRKMLPLPTSSVVIEEMLD